MPELLAPAGDWSCLEAALEAGADAVYFGLKTLNARRGARNFLPDEFHRAVAAAHARGARAYLTLNIDVAQRELGQAARMLELARRAGADAVLVRDAALLALRPLFPELEFHFSTQTCMTSSAEVAAGARLGAARAVLARELTLDEIAAASRVPGVQTEVFVQGALCFCVSGRCLLASWIGGRSGNRGACTSPCRVPWSVAGEPAGTPLSMRDLVTLEQLDALGRLGVAALKIEGRLKTAAWVRQAVSLYRRALDAPAGDAAVLAALRAEAQQLGGYTGRALTSGYLTGQRGALTGESGRAASADAADADQPPDIEPADDEACDGEEAGQNRSAASGCFDFEMTVTDKGIACRCVCLGCQAEWTIPKTFVHRPRKAVSIGQFLEWLGQQEVQGFRAARCATNQEDFLLVPRAVNALMDEIAAAVRRAQKGPDLRVRIDLAAAVQEAIQKQPAHAENRRHLGERPDCARLEAEHLARFVREARPACVIVEGLTADTLPRARKACRDTPLVVALPPVFFEQDIGGLQRLVQACAAAQVAVEVNSWGGWHLASQAGARIEGGPGLGVLNALAARFLAGLGMECVTLSPEADRRQLEDATAACPAPCAVVVFGRPPLMTTRVALPDDWEDQVLADRRGARMRLRREDGLWVFRPVEPFDLRGIDNPRIRVHRLVVDLVGSPDPLGEWSGPPSDRPLRFNYDRSLR